MKGIAKKFMQTNSRSKRLPTTRLTSLTDTLVMTPTQVHHSDRSKFLLTHVFFWSFGECDMVGLQDCEEQVQIFSA
ncbi:hypothetical protein Cabther_B0700 [Chloracidobacterium thermophilum B]|uniref:Uncharacterized protein n=1 Tax=Chloracidobacterium thermophilum (strain B) TaxID=981222 RepID=G2LL22_CHLTF|nr:hypothetical protein Cabther_B0700 [Chloracidobacterium thermophilum B]